MLPRLFCSKMKKCLVSIIMNLALLLFFFKLCCVQQYVSVMCSIIGQAVLCVWRVVYNSSCVCSRSVTESFQVV